jgi:hypothetical protein
METPIPVRLPAWYNLIISCARSERESVDASLDGRHAVNGSHQRAAVIQTVAEVDRRNALMERDEHLTGRQPMIGTGISS